MKSYEDKYVPIFIALIVLAFPMISHAQFGGALPGIGAGEDLYGYCLTESLILPDPSRWCAGVTARSARSNTFSQSRSTASTRRTSTSMTRNSASVRGSSGGSSDYSAYIAALLEEKRRNGGRD